MHPAYPQKSLALLGLSVFRKYLLVLDPNVLYTPYALFCWSGLIYMNEPQLMHSWGLLTWPINSTRPPSWPAWPRCRCQITRALSPTLWSSTQAPRLELKLVSVKMLVARPLQSTCLLSEATHIVFWGDISPYSLTSTHTTIINGWEALLLALPLYFNPSKSYAPFIVPFPFVLLFRILCSLSSSNQPPRLTSSIVSRCAFYLVTAFNLPHYSNAFNLVITALGLFTFLVIYDCKCLCFSLHRAFLQNTCASLSEYCTRLFAF